MTCDTDPETHVLVVDDSKVSRNMVIGLLKNRLPQARFHEAANGDDAIALAGQLSLALVVMDFNMPGIHGVEAAERILSQQPGVPTVLLTANAQSAVQAKADAIGIQMMKKPIKGELADQIAALIKVAV
jgi:two-component system, chemotaxis family, chemotaxis protein CheY